MRRFPKRFLLVSLLLGVFLFSQTLAFAQTNNSVSITVAPHASDFNLSLSNPITTTVNQNQTITYTVTYGSNLDYSDKMIVEAQWYQGTLQGAGTPSVDVVNYVAGSASNAYNSTSPVVDLVNNKIDWTISSFPAITTGQTITFQLKTNDSYTGSSTVTFPVSVRIIEPNYTTADTSISNTYQFNSALVTPTPTPTSAPTATPTTPTPTSNVALPTTTPTPAPLSFTSVDFREVTDQTISLYAATSNNTTLTTYYGTSTDFGQKIFDPTSNSQHLIKLTSLAPNTTYFVQLFATDSLGDTLKSDILTFQTAKSVTTAQVQQDTITIVSSDIVLYTPKNNSPNSPAPKPIIVVPQGVDYNFHFQVTKPETVKKVIAVVRNKYVLGISTVNAQEANSASTDLIETENGIWEGRLKTPSIPGSYEEYARIFDNKGNITEQKIADVTVSEPFRVYDSKSQQPIENAQVYLYYFNFQSNSFIPLPPQLFPVTNPSYTNLNGQIIFPLPAGKYQAKITAIGYKQKEVRFTIGPNPGEDYPAVLLTPEPFNLVSAATYYANIIQDVLQTTKAYVLDLSYSARFFELNALFASLILVFLTLLSFSSRIHIPLRYLLNYFLHYAKITSLQRKLGDKILGRVFDKETGNPLPNASVYLLDSSSQAILNHVATSPTGDFAFLRLPSQGYDLHVMADGYEPEIFRESEIHSLELGGYLLGVKKHLNGTLIDRNLGIFARRFLGIWFETLLIASFVFELSLGYTLGWDKAAIFLIISVINLTLWIIHLTHLRSERNIF